MSERRDLTEQEANTGSADLQNVWVPSSSGGQLPEEVEGSRRKQERGERVHHVERAVHVGAVVAEQGDGDAQHGRDGAVVTRECHAHEHKVVERREPPAVPRYDDARLRRAITALGDP